VCVLGLSSIAHANSYSVTTSNGGGCSSSTQATTGRSFEVGTTYDSFTGNGTASIMYVIQLGKKKMEVESIDCNAMYKNETRKQELELMKLEMQIELLKAQAAATLNGTTKLSIGNDW